MRPHPLPRASRPVSALCLRAPAKLNLFLRVVSRRPDGYHELETLFERIDLCDELVIEPRRQGLELRCDEPSLDRGADNLIMRAAALLQREMGSRRGATIRLRKRIPIAAGLGGGSSDAATALVGLNQLWNLRLSRPRLADLAAQLGSDVPFFLLDAPVAIGRGRGEQLEPVSTPLTLWHVLVINPVTISTKEGYEQFDKPQAAGSPESRLTVFSASITMMAHALRNGSLGELAKGLYNDLEPVAIRRCPIITDIQHRLRHVGCLGCLVSGSGSATFGLFPDAETAQRAASELRQSGPRDWRVEVVRTLSHTPVASRGR
ncbi:MAG: 4-(cytidine 5'-diphospho)-2-C-methyl-D-erythritol kinase [Candidatus Omnitrophica bacterium]|nr:4-(cytidine 5'-diphospho)-2-C-methyl-D-erythritol kinase [Candidatus Omnitrophota bacterium]